jgi:hypothetical protein
MKHICVVLLLVVPAVAAPRSCKNNPRVIGACYTVHARATFGPGTPGLRLWPVGTKRMLGITAGPRADDADEPICPEEMLTFTPGVESVWGDFEVCPFTPESKGEMQMVCVESASHLFKKRYATSK